MASLGSRMKSRSGQGQAAGPHRKAAQPPKKVVAIPRAQRRITALGAVWVVTAGMASFIAVSEGIREYKYQKSETQRLETMADRHASSIDEYLAHAKKTLRANVVLLDSHLPQIYKAEGLDTAVLDTISGIRRRILKSNPQSAAERLEALRALIEYKENIEIVGRDIGHLRFMIKDGTGENLAHSPFKDAAEGIHANLIRPFFHLAFVDTCLSGRSEAFCRFTKIWAP